MRHPVASSPSGMSMPVTPLSASPSSVLATVTVTAGGAPASPAPAPIPAPAPAPAPAPESVTATHPPGQASTPVKRESALRRWGTASL